MNEKQGMLILKLEKSSQQFFCENGNCEYGKIDYAYSWLYAKDMGWQFRNATIIRHDRTVPAYKASPYNSDLRDRGTNLIELYCPACGNSDK